MKPTPASIILAAALLIGACTGAPPPAPGIGADPQQAATIPPAEATGQEPAADPYPYPVEETQATDAEAYPAPGEDAVVEEPAYPAPENGGCDVANPSPQRHEFTAADGVDLVGTFYPSSTCNTPIVLLFHQFGSSKEAWNEIALWLQNRPLETGAAPPAWPPAMPAELSFAVFAIDFRGHGESGSGDDGFDDDGYLRDAQAALSFGRGFANVDPNRVITIGASIGADASVDVCLAIDGDDIADVQVNQGCIGAFSISPGSYLEISYIETVTRLGQSPFALEIRCLASESDGDSPALCGAEVPGRFEGTVYPGRSDHGMALLVPGLDPDIGQLLLDFLLDSLAIGG